MNKDKVNVDHEVQTEVTVPVGPVRFSKVKVISDDGIFKQGRLYGKDEEAVIEANAAKRFETNGDVEILGDAEAPESEA